MKTASYTPGNRADIQRSPNPALARAWSKAVFRSHLKEDDTPSRLLTKPASLAFTNGIESHFWDRALARLSNPQSPLRSVALRPMNDTEQQLESVQFAFLQSALAHLAQMLLGPTHTTALPPSTNTQGEFNNKAITNTHSQAHHENKM